MSKTNKKFNDSRIRSWMALQSLFIIIGAVCASLFVQYASIHFFGTTKDNMNWQYLKIIADESARLADLANSTILLSKLDTQMFVSNKTIYSLDETVKKLCHYAII